MTDETKTTKTKTCAICEWWTPKRVALTPNRPAKHGTCHGGPPTAGPESKAIWPITPATERCKAWEAKTEDADPASDA